MLNLMTPPRECAIMAVGIADSLFFFHFVHCSLCIIITQSASIPLLCCFTFLIIRVPHLRNSCLSLSLHTYAQWFFFHYPIFFMGHCRTFVIFFNQFKIQLNPLLSTVRFFLDRNYAISSDLLPFYGSNLTQLLNIAGKKLYSLIFPEKFTEVLGKTKYLTSKYETEKVSGNSAENVWYWYIMG